MIALAAILIGLSLGKACSGSFRALEAVRLRFELPVMVLFVVQAIVRGRIAGATASAYGIIVWVASCMVLVVLLAPDWRRPGVWVLSVGMALNVLVVLANGGMPIVLSDELAVGQASMPLALSMGFYQVGGAGTLMTLLGDAVSLSVAGYRILVSAGDILLALGVTVLIIHAMTVGQIDVVGSNQE